MSVPPNRREFDGEKFRRLRKEELDLSREELCRDIEKSVGRTPSSKTIYRWEKDGSTPSPLAYDTLLEYLGNEYIT